MSSPQWWLFGHVGFTLLSYGLFAYACGSAVAFLIQEFWLKHNHVEGWTARLPAIDVLERINAHALHWGFGTLTLGLLCGLGWAGLERGQYWNADPKEVWSLMTWVVYGLVIIMRACTVWRGRRIAWLSIMGFAFVGFTWIGVSYLLPSWHNTF